MSSSISVYAGKTAMAEVKANGLSSEQIKVMAGASGGPKWFTLFGLDKYLFGEFFRNRQQALHTIGSSAGSWRLACLAQKDPVAAIERLAQLYSHERYTEKPTVDEISDKADDLLKKVLADNGAKEIAENPVIQSHFIVARAKGLATSENRMLQMLGLIGAASTNAISRDLLNWSFQRVVFYSGQSVQSSNYFDYNDSITQYRQLKQNNVHQVLMASGAIPMVLRGIKDIPGSDTGVYRDGGIIDYHLDINFGSQGLVLYPHFFPTIKPGWFDKGLGYRRSNPVNFDRVIMVTPSSKHVSQLPHGKISDRNDFSQFKTEERIQYWQTVLQESERMAEDFSLLVEKGVGISEIQPIEKAIG
jgi:hypothetical protein